MLMTCIGIHPLMRGSGPPSSIAAPRGPTGFIQQALDIPIGQAAYVGADLQRFQWSRTDDAADVRDHSTHEAFDRTAHLRHGDSDLALGGMDRLVTAASAR